MSGLEKHIEKLELDRASALEDTDEKMAKTLLELPTWLQEFVLDVLQSLERPKTWRNGTPSLYLTGEVSEYLIIMKAPYLAKLIEADRWGYRVLVMILRAAAERMLEEELNISEEQAKEELQLILKYRGFAFYQPDPNAFNKMSLKTREYLVKRGLKRI